jgi:hypothetical protein
MNYLRNLKIGLLLLAAVAVLAPCAPAQNLQSGGISFTLPLHGGWEFMLWGGGQALQQAAAGINGFYYGGGTFHLYQNGLPGFCVKSVNVKIPGCRFDGTMGTSWTIPLDKYCTQLSFPLHGTLQILEARGLQTFTNVSALYTQTTCSVADGKSVFNSGGSLVVYLPGYPGL